MFHVSTDCTSSAPSASQGNSPFFSATTMTDKSLDFKKSIIKATLERLFTECKTPYQTALAYDVELHDLCLAEGTARSYPIHTPSDEASDTIDADRYLRAGVVLASAAYGYLPRHHQVYIALYTMWIVWFDDRYADADDIDDVEEFSERFMSRREQRTRGLEMMADLLRRVGEFWPGAIQGNIVLVSTLKYVTGGLLEDKINRKALSVSGSSKSFSGWLRSFTGVAEAYAMFIFPPELEIWKYVQAIQDICDWINGYNDTVSYYKEEKAGEANNYVSLEAAALGVDKLFVLNRLTNDTVTYNERVEGILSAHPDALHFFEMFKRGDLLFHSSMEKRYHLGELFL